MVRIDADAHIDETEATWEYLEDSERHYIPTTIENGHRTDQGWQFPGVVLRRPIRDYRRTGATAATSQLLDIDERLRHLDRLGIDTQVIFPTVFIRSRFAGHADLELALTRTYNRWIADRTSKSNGRLRWAAVLPLLSMDKAVEELRWAKDHGACGIFKKGVECEGRNAGDEYFFPLYEEANKLDVPICVHTGSDGVGYGLSPSALDAVVAFQPIVNAGLPEKFPHLRVAIIEAGAAWVPVVLSNDAGAKRRGFHQASGQRQMLDVDKDLLRRSRIFVTCQSHDDIPYILQFGTEDNLMIGTDYTHADQSAEMLAFEILEQRCAAGDFSAEVLHKIVEDNPRRFYGF